MPIGTSWNVFQHAKGVLSVCATVAFTLAVRGNPAPTAPDYVEGEALVQFQPYETEAGALGIAGRHGLEVARLYSGLSLHAGKVFCLVRSPSLTTPEVLRELGAEPSVDLAEPNYFRYPTELRRPNDALFGKLWGLRNTGQTINGLAGNPGADIGFLKAWGLARPATNEIVVAVIDTGIDPVHPDLAANLWTNTGETNKNGLDDDHNGYVDDLHGFDFSLHTGVLTDSSEHGTHVCGTVGAVGNNGSGVIGVDFQGRIMALKASQNGSNLVTSAIIEAVQYATMMKQRGVNVVAINASYGGTSSSSSERTAIQAAGNAGIIFVNAAGNDSQDIDTTPDYPASYRLSNMLVVAATDNSDDLATFSNYGATTVDLGAPGVDILSTSPLALPDSVSTVVVGTNALEANALSFAPSTAANGLAGQMYYCGLGYPADFPSGVQNNIALIQRGTLFFTEKVTNAKAAGAKAAVIFNNVPGNFSGTLQSSGTWIPAVSISQADGLALKAGLPQSVTVRSVVDSNMVYRLLSGTSMAAPHVAGAVAFAALNFPDETVAQRIQRVLSAATPVASLSGKTITGARLNLARIVDADENGLPDWWELQNFGRLTGTPPNDDPDADGASNLAEFLAGTNPRDARSVLRLAGGPNVPGGVVSLQWPSTSGRHYRISRSTNLFTGFTTLLQTNINATPPLNTLLDNPPGGPVFYRLELEP